jgi:AraC-like DNA-binding protein
MSEPIDDVHVTCAPSAQLTGLVTRYTGYRMTSAQPGVHRGLPSPTATLIATIDQPIRLLARPGVGEQTFDALVGGLHDWPELVAYGHVQEGMQIDVTPLGVRALFGMPIGEVRGNSFELADVVGRRATRLSERLRGTQCWQERFAICDQMLSRWASTPRSVDLVALRALEVLTARHGNLAIDQLADDVGFSRQHLTRRVRDELGLSPKRLAQIIRFDRARRMIEPDQSTRALARIAADCGYADHAHMSRAFRVFAGCGPTELFEDPLRHVPIVQADRDVGRASLVA